MSIIEKALDKLAERGDEDERPELIVDPPAERPRARQGSSTSHATPPRADFAEPAEHEIEAAMREVEAAAPPARAVRATTAPVPVLEPVDDAPPAEPDQPSRSTERYFEVNLDRLRGAGFITPDAGQSQLAEQYRIIKRPLVRKLDLPEGERPDRANLIMVTSSVPGEGKTFTSLNLAISLTMELDRRVLLVDTDVQRGGVSRVLGLDPGPGLSDYLALLDVDLADFLVRTNIPKLTLLPAGRMYPNLTELFASDDMERLCQEFATRYPDRVVVFDTAPLLATSGASVLAHHVGQVVMVVEALRTPQSALREALRMLDGVPSERIGLVLNKSREGLVSGYRYGYYGYGYGYGYGSSPQAKE
ncbi:MAG: AAA family ATPase [Ectothiorhodospiraceae bacterium]|nr:AAA family ATPase [Chromatiales bacterium]MCP5157214.1 AAA family ATPase [Ectothiorhodospiraceae bacterium]